MGVASIACWFATLSPLIGIKIGFLAGVAFRSTDASGKNSQTGIMTIVLTPLCYAYLAGSIVLFAIWLVFFLLRRDLHKEMLTMSALIGVLSVLTGYIWWTVDWWKPPTITHTIVGVEDLVMGFAAGGIMAAAYEVLFRRHLYHVRGKHAREASPYTILIMLALVTALLFWVFRLTSFWASTIALLVGAAVLFYSRPNLFLIGLLSGILMAVISLSFYFTIIWLSPGWINHTYQFRTLSKVVVLGIPIEEFTFWFLAGLVMGPFYEYWTCDRLRKAPARHAKRIHSGPEKAH